MADARVWRAIPADRAVAIPLDTLTALYDRGSGLTHLIASPLPEILTALGSGSGDVAALHTRLAATFDFAEHVDDAEIILLARLEELAAMGLVHAA